jgi:nitrogen regulatory protein PII 2
LLKEVIAVIRPGKWSATLLKLDEAGFPAFTRHRVYGRGKQKGLEYGAALEGTKPGAIPLLPKWMIHLIVEDFEVQKAVDIIVASNRTGEIGDGKIFVCPLAGAVRVRPGEADRLP